VSPWTRPLASFAGLSADAPIGMFDSGVGGLTVARAVIDQLPAERLIYVGDTAHSPYGPQSVARVRGHALALGDELVVRGVKMLVIACNSASSACLVDARERYPVPVVEVIRPAVRRAVSATRNGRIGVIATEVTIRSGAYTDTFAGVPDVEVVPVACPRFVDFIERGMTSGRQVLGLVQSYLEPLQRAQVDTVVLGCTHYPLMTGVLQLALGPDVTLVSSAEETAKDVLRTLSELDLLREPTDDTDDPTRPGSGHEFLATGDPAPFRRLGRRFLGPEIDAVARWPRHSGRSPDRTLLAGRVSSAG
jgi:glutamate racemase